MKHETGERLKKSPTAVLVIHLLYARIRCKSCLVGFLVSLLRTAVLINPRTTAVWAVTSLQNIYLRQALCLKIPFFLFQFAFVSPVLAFRPGSQCGCALQRG